MPLEAHTGQPMKALRPYILCSTPPPPAICENLVLVVMVTGLLPKPYSGSR